MAAISRWLWQLTEPVVPEAVLMAAHESASTAVARLAEANQPIFSVVAGVLRTAMPRQEGQEWLPGLQDVAHALGHCSSDAQRQAMRTFLSLFTQRA